MKRVRLSPNTKELPIVGNLGRYMQRITAVRGNYEHGERIKEEGQTLIEFALVLPILAVLVLGLLLLLMWIIAILQTNTLTQDVVRVIASEGGDTAVVGTVLVSAPQGYDLSSATFTLELLDDAGNVLKSEVVDGSPEFTIPYNALFRVRAEYKKYLPAPSFLGWMLERDAGGYYAHIVYEASSVSWRESSGD